jgi:hypothetical protein
LGILRKLLGKSHAAKASPTPRHLRITPEGSSEKESCDHCGNPTKVIWSLVDDHDGAYAVYYACWTPGHGDRGVKLYVSIGGWGEGADREQKVAVGLDSRMGADRPSFTVIDAHELSWSKNANLGRPLTREEAFASGAAEDAFNIVDHALEQDERLRAFYRTGE